MEKYGHGIMKDILFGHWKDTTTISSKNVDIFIDKEFRVVNNTFDESFDCVVNKLNHSIIFVMNENQRKLFQRKLFSFEYSLQNDSLSLYFIRGNNLGILPNVLVRHSQYY